MSQLQVAFKVLEMYSGYLCRRDDITNIQKFAKTVTNKVTTFHISFMTLANDHQWLLHLLAEDEPIVVVLAAKIMSRLLVISGPSYVHKFVEKTRGITIMRHRLKRWWNVPPLWPICFAALFGIDLGVIDFTRPFDLFGLLEVFASGRDAGVVYPAMLPVLTAMLQSGLMTVTSDQLDPDSPLTEKSNGREQNPVKTPTTSLPTRQRSMSLDVESYTQST